MTFVSASQIIFVFYLDKGIRNKHNVQGEKAQKGIMVTPAQLSISVHANFLLSLVNSGSVY